MADINQALFNKAGAKVAFGSVGASYGDLLAGISGQAVIIYIMNTLDQEVVLSLDGGTTDWMILPASTSFTIDMKTNGLTWAGDIEVKHNGTAATSGNIYAAVIGSE